jgi:hypothetical protein
MTKCRMAKNVERIKCRIDIPIMSKVRKDEWEIMSNGTKRRIEIMLKVRKADKDKMSNGKKNVASKQCRNQKI